MVAFGAHLNIIPSVNCQVTANLTPQMIDAAQAIANQPGSYSTNLLHNPDVVKGYKMLGCELLAQVEVSIHSVCGGVGTTGMLMKVARAF